MPSAMHRVAEAALGVAALALLVVLAAPWRQPALPDPSAGGRSSARPQPTGAAAAAQAASPEAILPLLIGRQAPRAAAPAPAPVPPQPAPWMKYLGRALAADGSAQVYLKDTKTGRLVTAAVNGGTSGWILVNEQDDSVIVKNGDTVYSVGKR